MLSYDHHMGDHIARATPRGGPYSYQEGSKVQKVRLRRPSSSFRSPNLKYIGLTDSHFPSSLYCCQCRVNSTEKEYIISARSRGPSQAGLLSDRPASQLLFGSGPRFSLSIIAWCNAMILRATILRISSKFFANTLLLE